MVNIQGGHDRRKKQKPLVPTRLRMAALDDSPGTKSFLALVNAGQDETGAVSADFSRVTAYIREDCGELKVLIGIEEETRGQDIRDALPLIIDLRDTLLELRGVGPWDEEKAVYLDLVQEHRAGCSWATMAKRINAEMKRPPPDGIEGVKRQSLIDAIGMQGEDIYPDQLRDKVRNFQKSNWYKYVLKWASLKLVCDDELPEEED